MPLTNEDIETFKLLLRSIESQLMNIRKRLDERADDSKRRTDKSL